MNVFSNNKLTLIVLSSGLIILISFLFFPGIFGRKVVDNVPKEDPEISQIKTQSSDTSLDSIKKDLDGTDVTSVDKELNSIEKEINAAI